MWSIFKDVSFADFFSLANLTVGFIGILSGNIKLVFIAAIMDGLDGFVSKYSSGKLGEELDSLADIVSFGILPAFFVYKFFPIAALAYILASALRLARFNVMKMDGFKGFKGLPITAAALIVSSVFLVFPKAFVLVTFIVSALMICDLKYPKVRETSLLLVVGIILISAFFIRDAIYAVLFMFSLYVLYPTVGWYNGRHRKFR